MREAPCDTVLPGGWFIKKGEVVRAGGFASHTGTFPGGFANPLDFAPDRWLDGSTASEPAGFLPFSAGPRACAGQSMAQLQLRVLLARFAHLFSFSPAPGAPPVVPVMTLTLFARDGIVLAAAPRAGRRP